MEESNVAGVEAALEALEVVRLLPAATGHHVGVRNQGPLPLGNRGPCLGWPHVSPYHTTPFGRRIGGHAHPGLEATLGRLVRHVDATTIDVVLPAVVDTAQA